MHSFVTLCSVFRHQLNLSHRKIRTTPKTCWNIASSILKFWCSIDQPGRSPLPEWPNKYTTPTNRGGQKDVRNDSRGVLTLSQHLGSLDPPVGKVCGSRTNVHRQMNHQRYQPPPSPAGSLIIELWAWWTATKEGCMCMQVYTCDIAL